MQLYDKRDAFPYSIVRMPHLDSNTASTIYYASTGFDILWFARNTLDIIPLQHFPIVNQRKHRNKTVNKDP